MSAESERAARRERRAEAADQWAAVPRREFERLEQVVKRLEHKVARLEATRTASTERDSS